MKSWVRKTLRAIGIGSKVAGEVIGTARPSSIVGTALEVGGDALATAMKPAPKPKEEVKDDEPEPGR